MASTTYEHPGDVTEMYAAQEQFRHITKMVELCKICVFDLKYWLKSAIFTNEFNFSSPKSSIHHHFAVIGNMVRNAGQLPQPFWLGAARGGGSRSAAPCAAKP
jgi:hypothetical protein